MPNFKTDKLAASQWAQGLLQRSDKWIIIDTETTGFDGAAEIVQIAAIDGNGKTLIDSLVKPVKAEIHATASAIHGITVERLDAAPRFDAVFSQLVEVIDSGKEVVIYNASYDTRLIKQSLKALDLTWNSDCLIHCAMHYYSQWVGDWNHKRGSYRWQKLVGGDHTAIGDCLATLDLIRTMGQ